jgi:putative transposase
VQAAKNFVMDLDDNGSRARYMIRDRDGRFPELFDAVLADAGIDVVLSGIRVPRMHSIMERRVQTIIAGHAFMQTRPTGTPWFRAVPR